MAWISPARKSSDTSLSAVIGPKLFVSPRTPSMEAAASLDIEDISDAQPINRLHPSPQGRVVGRRPTGWGLLEWKGDGGLATRCTSPTRPRCARPPSPFGGGMEQPAPQPTIEAASIIACGVVLRQRLLGDGLGRQPYGLLQLLAVEELLHARAHHFPFFMRDQIEGGDHLARLEVFHARRLAVAAHDDQAARRRTELDACRVGRLDRPVGQAVVHAVDAVEPALAGE